MRLRGLGHSCRTVMESALVVVLGLFGTALIVMLGRLVKVLHNRQGVEPSNARVDALLRAACVIKSPANAGWQQPVTAGWQRGLPGHLSSGLVGVGRFGR